MSLTVIQALPALEAGGVERGTVEVATELVRQGHRAIVVSAGGRLVSRLREAGVEHVTLPIGRKSPLTLRHVSALRDLLRGSGAQILHARSRLPAWIAHLALRRLGAAAKPHFITTVHGPYSANRYSGIMVRGERVIAISEFIRRYILENYPDTEPERITVIPRGVSAAEFPHGYRPAAGWLSRWHGEFPRLAGVPLVTLPARITAWKGQEDFISIMARLRDRGVSAHGLIVGGAERRRQAFLEKLQRMVRDRALQSWITFTGHRDDLREIMATSHVVMSLAQIPEAFGRTALESLSLGTPVVAYAHGGAAEVLQPMYPEGLVPPGDVEAAAACVRRVLDTGERAPERHPYPLQLMLDRTLALYAEVAGGQAP